MNKQLLSIRLLLAFFMIALVISGVTAIPVSAELNFLLRIVPQQTTLHFWLSKVLTAYDKTALESPFLLYGYDWLAFAHFILAILFIGPYRQPVKNIWVIEFGMIACVLIFPLAFIAGPFRGIPLGWRLIDCSFGVLGLAVLLILHGKIKSLSNSMNTNSFSHTIENKIA